MGAVLLALLLPGGVAGAGISPAKLYQRLLAAKVQLSPRVAVLAGARPKTGRLSATARAHHAIGEIDVEAAHAAGTYRYAAVYWVVFPSHALAVSDFRVAAFTEGITNVRILPAFRYGFPTPSELVFGTSPAAQGVTDVHAVVGNVIVSGVARTVVSKQTALKTALDLDLAHWAIDELKRVQAGK